MSSACFDKNLGAPWEKQTQIYSSVPSDCRADGNICIFSYVGRWAARAAHNGFWRGGRPRVIERERRHISAAKGVSKNK